MRYTDNRIFPRIRDRMREWIHPDMSVSHKHSRDVHIQDNEADDDEGLAWRQYIL
jgi:hypothetical protein